MIKPIPLELKVGKRYRAKNGSIVTIFNADETYFYGVIDGRKTIEVFRSNGECVSDDFNLVEEL